MTQAPMSNDTIGLSAAPEPSGGGGSRGTPAVACQGLVKVFRDFWLRDKARAVDNLSFTVEPHEIFGLLGPNGSGKSTTIKIILGLLKPTKGRVAVLGKPPDDVAVKSRIGYLPEESLLYPFLNARETLDYYGRLFQIHGRTRTKRIDELLEMVGLTGAQFRPVREYSKGMQRRIGLAQALINDPDFLILDEPTTGLDPIGTRQVKDLIIELGRRGKTVLLSSHLLSDVEDVVDRMIILYGGKKRDEGTTAQLLESTSKTTIETDALDDETIAQIDRIIRERSGGHQSVLRVSHPRQKLEEKFLEIVERARADRVETSGAAAGGETASFLKGDGQAEQPGALIDRLISDEDTTAESITELPASAGSEEPVASRDNEGAAVLAALVGSDSAPSSPGETPSADAGTPSEPSGDRDGEGPKPPVQSTPSTPIATSEPESGASVDLGVIGSLLGDDGAKDGEAKDGDQTGRDQTESGDDAGSERPR